MSTSWDIQPRHNGLQLLSNVVFSFSCMKPSGFCRPNGLELCWAVLGYQKKNLHLHTACLCGYYTACSNLSQLLSTKVNGRGLAWLSTIRSLVCFYQCRVCCCLFNSIQQMAAPIPQTKILSPAKEFINFLHFLQSIASALHSSQA